MSRRRRILLAIVGALLGLVLCAPFLARTDAARRYVASRMSEALGRPVEIEGLAASWTSGVEIRGLVVRNAAAEFQEPLLEARSITLANTLPGLLVSGADDIAIDGLKLRLEEQSGGRTNVDDLVQAFAKPRAAEPAAAQKPFRFRLKDASVEFRRLARRGRPPIDPFREDPTILDATDGLVVVKATDLDLLLDALPGTAAITLKANLDVAGSPGRADVALRLDKTGPSGHARIEGLDLSLLRPFVPGLEGRLDVQAEGSQGDVALTAHATGFRWKDVEEATIDLTGRLKKDGDALAFENVSLKTASGRFALDARGAWPAKGIEIKALVSPEPLGFDVKGPLTIELRGGPDLTGTLAGPDLDVRFDARLLDDGVEIERLDAKAFQSSLSAKGEIRAAVRVSGSADVNLKDLEPFLHRALAGRVQVSRFEWTGLALKADAQLKGVLVLEDSIDGAVHLDAALSEDGDAVRVARAQFDDLAAEGTVSGLKSGKIVVEGSARGTVPLTMFHARLLKIPEVRGLRGQLTLDVIGTAKEVAGSAKIEGLHLETGRGTWDLAAVTASGRWSDGLGEIHAAADGATLEGSFAEGKGTVALDVAAIERHPILVGYLPPEIEVKGPLKFRGTVLGPPWAVEGTLASDGLLAKFDGKGVEGETLRLSFAAREEEDVGWLGEVSDLTLSKLGVKASLTDVVLGSDGSKHIRLRFEAPMEKLAVFVPVPLSPRGQLAIDAKAAYAGGWSFVGTLDAKDASAFVAGKRAPSRSAHVEFDAAPSEAGLALRKVHVVSRATDLMGSAFYGDAKSFKLKGRARLDEWAPYAPAFRGAGDVVVDELAVDLAADGAFSVKATLHAEEIRLEGGELAKATLKSDVTGRLVDGKLDQVSTDMTVTAERAARGNMLFENLLLREQGKGHTGAYSLGTRVGIGRVQIGGTSWDEVALDVRGRLDRILGERPPSGLKGDIAFARWTLGPFVWTDAKGKVSLEQGEVIVRDLAAGLLGGTSKLEGKLKPTEDRIGWEGTCHAEGVVLSEQIGKPLSFVLPMLRVHKKAGQLTGRADFDVRLSADDTTEVGLLRSLAGQGTVHLFDVEVRDSILLPLLSLRIDKAILNKPFRFKEGHAKFEVGDGSIRTEPFELEATPFGLKVKEAEVGLEGSLNVLFITGILPLRARGTLDEPDVKPAPLAPFR